MKLLYRYGLEVDMPEREYVTLIGEGLSSVEDRKSRFIGRARHVEREAEAYEFVDAVKRLEKGARHNVYAFSLGLSSEIVRSSDDGEPSATAGRPCLEAIKLKGLTDCIVVVTRYFGGTLLGTGGLVRAYGLAARDAIVAAGIGVRVSYRQLEMSIEYSEWGRLSDFLARRSVLDLKAEFMEKVKATFLVKDKEKDFLIGELTDLLSGKAQIKEVAQKHMLEEHKKGTV
jgi:uncharacterized YigZ family protein